MIPLAAGYQHLPDGAPFAEIALRHPQVREVYFPWVDEPSGRPRLGYGAEDDPAELKAALRRDLARLREAGVALDLLLNANCCGAEAVSRRFEQRIAAIVAELVSWRTKPDVVTTASPFVARTVKKAFPEIEVRASANLHIDTLQALKYLEPLFDSFCIGRAVQRNPETVKRMSDWCRARGKRLCLLANSGCLRNCPWHTFHDNLIAHAEEAMKADNVRDWNPHLCWTLYRDPANFAEILKSTWIRPEDVANYEGVVDLVKLATRQHDNPAMVIGAYARGRFDGNLLDLFEPGFSPAFYPHFVDNTAFPSDWFARTGSCRRECSECGYCEAVAKTVFRQL